MTMLLAASDGLMALSLAIVLAAIYLLVVRFIDLNEKEPLWSMGTVFAVGVAFAVALHSFGDTAALQLNLVAGPITVEAVKFLAVAAAVGVLTLIGRRRGHSELNGLLDGVVYGTSVGLGFATGAVVVYTFTTGDNSSVVAGALGLNPAQQLWPLALSGLSEGVFGGIIGAGFGAALGSEKLARRIAFIAGGAVLAAGGHVLYEWFTRGNAFSPGGAVRATIGLALPVLFLVAVMVAALRAEKRVINAELPAESDTGAVTDDELALLRSFTARRSAYLTRLFGGDFEGWMALKALHNKQVQLALAKDAVAKRGGEDPHLQEEVNRLRGVIAALRTGTESTATTEPQTDGMGA